MGNGIVIASGPSDGNAGQHVYLFKWRDFSHEENTWEIYENVVDSNPRLLEECYKKNPMMEKDGRFGLETRKKGRKQK